MNGVVVAGPDGGGLLTVTLDDPGRRNALSEAMVRALSDVMARAEADERVRAVVLTGSGEAFSAGADLRELAASGEKSVPEAFHEGVPLLELFRRGARFSRPLIGAVNGWALGGGLGLVALCHLAVASDRARFGATEIRVGMFPMVVLPALARAVGQRRALELSLTGRLFGAEEAVAMGLVHRAVPHERLMEETLSVARLIAGFSPLAVRTGLRGWAQSQEMPGDASTEYLHALRLVLAMSEDFREGARAFLERRNPGWKGR